MAVRPPPLSFDHFDHPWIKTYFLTLNHHALISKLLQLITISEVLIDVEFIDKVNIKNY